MDSAWLVPVSLGLRRRRGRRPRRHSSLAARRGQRAVHVVEPGRARWRRPGDRGAGIRRRRARPVEQRREGVARRARVRPGAGTRRSCIRSSSRSSTGCGATASRSPRSSNLARGPFGDANIYLFVRVARLGARYVLLLAEDRTESYRLDDVRRDFVANISHELKTPIGAVSLLAEALKAASNEPDQVRRFAKRLTKESERLARITHGDHRTLPAAGRRRAGQAGCRRHRPRRARSRSTRTGSPPRPATSDSSAAATPEPRSTATSRCSIVAVHNLISNAIAYSPNGSRVGIGVKPRRRHRGDRRHRPGHRHPRGGPGAGLRAVLPHRPARARDTGGSGLGLSIVKHVVQNHGGDVRVWSQPGTADPRSPSDCPRRRPRSPRSARRRGAESTRDA